MLPEQVEAVIMRAWDKTPQDRPSFNDIVKDIQSSLVTITNTAAGAGADNSERFKFRRDSAISVSDLQPILEDSRRELPGIVEQGRYTKNII